MYGKLSITRFFWHLAIFRILFGCWLMNIFLTQFWTVKLLIHKPQHGPKSFKQTISFPGSSPSSTYGSLGSCREHAIFPSNAHRGLYKHRQRTMYVTHPALWKKTDEITALIFLSIIWRWKWCCCLTGNVIRPCYAATLSNRLRSIQLLAYVFTEDSRPANSQEAVWSKW